MKAEVDQRDDLLAAAEVARQQAKKQAEAAAGELHTLMEESVAEAEAAGASASAVLQARALHMALPPPQPMPASNPPALPRGNLQPRAQRPWTPT